MTRPPLCDLTPGDLRNAKDSKPSMLRLWQRLKKKRSAFSKSSSGK
jgi:hypothetical protein